MQNKVQIFILSKDRPDYLKETIDSVLNQKILTAKVEIIVSDNSENDKVEEMIAQDYSKENFKYIKRHPSLPPLEHFQTIISECKEGYVVLFHDDDIMHPDYVETMLPYIQKKGAAAVGCNAFIFENNFKKAILGKPYQFKGVKTFTNERDFFKQQIPSSGGISAFAGHMYNAEFFKKIELDNVRRKGAFSDVLMLSSLLEYGGITWIPNFLMYYRFHNNNDGKHLYIADHIAVLNRMSYSGLNKNTDALTMRFVYLLRWFMAQDINKIFLWRNKIVLKYLFFKSFVLFFRLDSWKHIFNNNYVKEIFIK